ncbi:MAG: hypothetical protein A2252_01690 [Elusimicrobia bacterium RIFOXYA2_FULL_39_19]|nr:MAG: hypothetical protein A2252_01690 [Elusimicrobia bacterium RIFOXYA2_FULL_39_19]
MNLKSIKTLFIFLILILFQSLSIPEMRQAAVSGQFYPGDPAELKQTITGFYSKVPQPIISGELLGILVPHAGYVFSGPTAAYAFKYLQAFARPPRVIDTIIILGQSHNFPLSKSAVFTGDGFSLPLGSTAIDTDITAELLKDTFLFEANNDAHVPEHSLEVEIPFLQMSLTSFKIVPILIGSDTQNCKITAEKLVSAVKKFPNKKVIFVISTDMSHYPDHETANLTDKKALEALSTLDPEKLLETNKSIMKQGHKNLACEFCGLNAVVTGMYAVKLLDANKVEILHYSNSGETPNYGDKSRVVGYGAAVFLKTNSKNTENSNNKEQKKKEAIPMEQFKVTEINQEILLALARNTIKEYVRSKIIIPFETEDKELTTPRAVFVTLNRNKQLRGCIGTTIAQMPLYQAVQQMAIAAATEDYRFMKVTEKEIPDIKIEISVLSPLTKIKSHTEIKENVHGVIARKGSRSGLFLPQVWEHFSNKEGFMNELCSQKAGLPENAWKDTETELYTFTVFAFEEK